MRYGVETAPLNDNSNHIANTEFVTRALIRPFKSINNAITLTANDYTIHITGGTFTQELPLLNAGKLFEFVNTSMSDSVTITPIEGTINNSDNVVIPPGHSVTVRSTGTSSGITYIITSQY